VRCLIVVLLLLGGCVQTSSFILGDEVEPPIGCVVGSLRGVDCYALLQDVLSEAHRGHKYVTDYAQYGVEEYWTPSLVGDCEDFALWVKAELEKRGIAADLVVALTEDGEGHAVIHVGGWILDNRYKYVVSIDELRYTWISIGRAGKWYDVITTRR